VLLLLIIGVVFKFKSASLETAVDNGATYVNPAFANENASPTYEMAPGQDDAAYDFVTGASAAAQGGEGLDHTALNNATYAGLDADDEFDC